ncbi:glycoside hydrolase family 47 protein [Thermothelomyces heterothallicus CBS 202.75]|uniref:glycoside hydrolase family 47 protein n=1 Tax=Thermothelomyces heterothallicus CBS 202.75 TaxID=1149848 RepID=UPI0037430DD7
MLSAKRRGFFALFPAAAILLFLVTYLPEGGATVPKLSGGLGGLPSGDEEPTFWARLPVHYPPSRVRPLPTGKPVQYPRVQAATFPVEKDPDARARRQERRAIVRDVFHKAWLSYRELAWGADELAPLSGGTKNRFGGWGATLVDALDTLWIMNLRPEFDEAVARAATINFTRTDLPELNVFETNIRYLGGFLSAYDLSGDGRLLRKAVEVGDMLYKAFDTPNRMPIARWDLHAAARGAEQVAGKALLAEVATLSMEFTRLSMLTGDPKWFDAVQRVADAMAAQQDSTALPGLWPLEVDGNTAVFNSGSVFALGSMADSAYEYLPKMAALTGGRLPVYRRMYEKAVDAAMKHNIFRPLTPADEDILVAGNAHATEHGIELEPQGQHLACFWGGMMALAARLFGRDEDAEPARKLVEGCIWTYRAFPHGVMAEAFTMAPCPAGAAAGDDECRWDEAAWKREVLRRAGKDPDAAGSDAEADAIIKTERLPEGFTSISDRAYVLRPEAIESIFVLYRVTGREDLLEAAWDMFTAIDRVTSTELANAAVRDVTAPDTPEQTDSMESFWLAETLKYFYLIFSDPKVISLDEYVFNTEAHPFLRPLK